MKVEGSVKCENILGYIFMTSTTVPLETGVYTAGLQAGRKTDEHVSQRY